MNNNAIVVVAGAVPGGIWNAQIAAMDAAGMIINLTMHGWLLFGLCLASCIANIIVAVRRR